MSPDPASVSTPKLNLARPMTATFRRNPPSISVSFIPLPEVTAHVLTTRLQFFAFVVGVERGQFRLFSEHYLTSCTVLPAFESMNFHVCFAMEPGR